MGRLPGVSPTESTVEDFSLLLFDYDDHDRVVHQQLEIRFLMGATRVSAMPNICVTDAQCTRRRTSNMNIPKIQCPQLVAEAVAAFSHK